MLTPTLRINSGSTANERLHWLGEGSCPEDLLPLVLAFAGPQKTAVLSHTSTVWKSVMDQESTWKGLLVELYKVRGIKDV